MVVWWAAGRSNDEIAVALVISSANGPDARQPPMLTLGARDRARLAVFGIESARRVDPA